MRRPDPYQGIALIAPVTVPYERHSTHGAMWFLGRSLALALEASGLDKDEVDGITVSSFTLAPDSVSSVAEHLGLDLGFAEQIPLGGASGIAAIRRAARAVQAGDAEVVACLAGDTADPGSFTGLIKDFSRFSRGAAYRYGAAGPNGVFAMIAADYMARTGATREDFARLCVAQRHNAAANPDALLRKPLTVDDYLQARPIAEPFHLFDCVMPCAGGEAMIVTTEDRARSLGVPYATILASGERHNAFRSDPIARRGGWRLYRDALYEQAGFGPDALDLVNTYDDYPVISFIQLEELGLCGEGEAAAFVRRTNLDWDGGGLPHNTSGGQLSCGQAGAAGGFLGLVEAVRQVTGMAHGRQIPCAARALVSGYGMVNFDRGICTAAAIVAGAGR